MSGSAGQIGGIDFTQKDTTPQFTLGYVVDDIDGGSWAYVKANAALTAYLMYKRLPLGLVGSGTAKDDAVDSDSASFLGGFHVCWPQQAFTSGEYGWVRLSGQFTAKCGANCAAGAKLYTMTTAGVVDDTAASNFSIIGDANCVALIGGADATGLINVCGREPFLSPTAGV